MDAPTKELPVLVSLYVFWSLHETDPPGTSAGAIELDSQVKTTASMPNFSFVSNYLLRSIDRRDPASDAMAGRWGAGVHCSLLTMLITSYHIPNRSPRRNSALAVPDPLYARK